MTLQHDEYDETWSARANRIKAYRRALLNTFIVLSGGAIILSVTLLEKIAPHKAMLWFLVVSWLFFGAALLFALYALVIMVTISINVKRVKEGKEALIRYTSTVIRFPYELVTGCLFVFGVLFLSIFAIVNVLSGK